MSSMITTIIKHAPHPSASLLEGHPSLQKCLKTQPISAYLVCPLRPASPHPLYIGVQQMQHGRHVMDVILVHQLLRLIMILRRRCWVFQVDHVLKLRETRGRQGGSIRVGCVGDTSVLKVFQHTPRYTA